jgi:hypothetical protein
VYAVFCPECRCEYVEGVTHCPDCDVDLVEKLASPRKQIFRGEEIPREYRHENWVMIYNPASAQELAFIKMILEREKIPCFIGNELSRRAVLYAPSNLAFELWVPEKFAGRAGEVLREEL